MPIQAAIRVAIAALLKHRMRTTLTTLGIGVGIAAVICTVAIGQGSSASIRQELLSLGDNFIWVSSASKNMMGVRTGLGGAPSLTPADVNAIPASVARVKACTPQVNGRTQVIAGDQNWNTNYRGVSPAFFPIRAWTFQRGGSFGPDDVTKFTNVTVLGSSVAKILFGSANPVGQRIRVGSLLFTVVGVTAPKGQSVTAWDQDDIIFLPYTTAQKKLRGVTWVDDIMCSVTDAADIPIAEAQVTALLRSRHRTPDGAASDFRLRDPQERLELREQTAKTMGLTLLAVASISLVVGGVGILNIMLVSVAERTHEIGLRMAIGARGADIQRQFLAEAVVLGAVGGTLGIVLGFASSHLLTSAFGWPMIVSPETVAGAVGAASVAGLVFGYLPARHAAALPPIDALRAD